MGDKMAIDQKANLKRMKEIIEQLKAMQEDKNAPDIDKVVPNEKDTSKLKTELQNIVNKETILYSFLDRIKEIVRLLSVTPKDKKIKNSVPSLRNSGIRNTSFLLNTLRNSMTRTIIRLVVFLMCLIGQEKMLWRL